MGSRVGYMWSFCSNSPCPCIVGPHWPMMLYTYSLIIVPSVLFLVYVAPDREVWEVLIFAAVFASTVVSFTVTACKDPGVHPPAPTVADPESGTIMFAAARTEDTSLPAPRGGDGSDQPFERRRHKFCKYCNVNQPINSVHCQDCGVCIVDLDHHCPWTGKCIGKHNLMAFHSFLCSLLALMIAFTIMTVQYAMTDSPPPHPGRGA